MVTVKYVVTVGLDDTLHVLRQGQSDRSEERPALALPTLDRASPECARELALALLTDCLDDEARAQRLCRPFVDLMVAPLLLRSNWVLTNEDIEDAIQAIEDGQGWLWLEDGHYLDEEKWPTPDEMN